MGLVKENLFFIVSKEVKIKLCKVGEIKEIVRVLYNKIDVSF